MTTILHLHSKTGPSPSKIIMMIMMKAMKREGKRMTTNQYLHSKTALSPSMIMIMAMIMIIMRSGAKG